MNLCPRRIASLDPNIILYPLFYVCAYRWLISKGRKGDGFNVLQRVGHSVISYLNIVTIYHFQAGWLAVLIAES